MQALHCVSLQVCLQLLQTSKFAENLHRLQTGCIWLSVHSVEHTASLCHKGSRQAAAEWPDSNHGPVPALPSSDRKAAPLQEAPLGLLQPKAGLVQPQQ